MHQERFYLNTRKRFFTVGTVIQWNNLPKDVVKSLLLEVFKMQFVRMPGNVI